MTSAIRVSSPLYLGAMSIINETINAAAFMAIQMECAFGSEAREKGWKKSNAAGVSVL